MVDLQDFSGIISSSDILEDISRSFFNLHMAGKSQSWYRIGINEPAYGFCQRKFSEALLKLETREEINIIANILGVE